MLPGLDKSAEICVIGKYRQKMETVINKGLEDYFSKKNSGSTFLVPGNFEFLLLDQGFKHCLLIGIVTPSFNSMKLSGKNPEAGFNIFPQMLRTDGANNDRRNSRVTKHQFHAFLNRVFTGKAGMTTGQGFLD